MGGTIIFVRNIKYFPRLLTSRNFVSKSRGAINYCVNNNKSSSYLSKMSKPSVNLARPQSTEEKKPENLSTKQKLQKAVAEYGSTVIVFHIGISLVSLGGFYLAVSSGLDVNKILVPMGLSAEIAEKFAGAGTFAVAYGIHKIFAPARIMITLTATPFIVRYLRQIGFLKKP